MKLLLRSIALGAFLWISSLVSGQEKTVHCRIVDSETGLPLAATVVVTDEEGHEVDITGRHEPVVYIGRTRWYVDSEFTISTGDRIVYVEIRRGPETIPLHEEIDMKGDLSIPREFRLERWIDMKSRGLMSGDSHMHLPDAQSAQLQMRAEDLQVANLLTSDFTDEVINFTGHLDPASTENAQIYVGQEIRDWQLGHANLLNLKSIVEPLEPFGGSLFSMGSNPNMLLSPRLEEAKKQGATVVWAHFSNLPGLESAMAIPLGLVDALELMTYDDPTQLPSHQAPWDYSEFSPVEFPPMRGVDLYYQFLNAGINLPITAGTDKMSQRIPVGSNRNYVRIEGERNYENWIEGMKKGRGFITNGPILTFSVDGHLSGETVEFHGEKKVKVKVKAESILPFGRVEIIANGKLIAWEYLEDYRRRRDLYVAELELELQLSESTWIAGRVSSLDTPQMLPRNLTVFAHSNPIYLLEENKQVHVDASVEYLLDYLESCRNWINKHSSFGSKKEKSESLKYLDKAKARLDQ